MTDSFIGRSERLVRPTLGVDRAGSATDHPHRDRRHDREHPPQDQHPDRRDAKPPNPLRRRLYDLLFEEIDDIEALSPGQKTRIKDNLRTNLSAAAQAHAQARQIASHPPHPAAPRARLERHPLPGALPPAIPPASDEEDESLAQALLADPALEVDHDGIVGLAVADGSHLTPDEVLENARLTRQMHDCLALHTERARKVAVYLHLLLGIHPDPRPHVMVVDV